MTTILASRRFEKQLKRLPKYVQGSAIAWIEAIRDIGIREVRKIPGYHDEPLKGIRQGQRSVRLNRAYRLIYKEENKQITIITILEVHKHAY